MAIDPIMLRSQQVNTLLNKGLSLETFINSCTLIGVSVIQKGQITTRELRNNNTRFFAKVVDGIVIAGYFG